MSGFTPEMRDKAAVTRKQNAERRAAEKISSSGFGESKIFGGVDAHENPILDCHVGGVLVREMLASMTEPMAAIVEAGLSYGATDEGIAQRNEGKSALRVEITSDPFNKALEQRRDDVTERDFESYEARDPLKEVHDAHIQPGMRGKFLSARKVRENGGTGDYEVVKDAHGQPVSVRGMILGQMPEKRAKARNKHYQERSTRILTEMTERYKQEGGQTAVADQ